MQLRRITSVMLLARYCCHILSFSLIKKEKTSDNCTFTFSSQISTHFTRPRNLTQFAPVSTRDWEITKLTKQFESLRLLRTNLQNRYRHFSVEERWTHSIFLDFQILHVRIRRNIYLQFFLNYQSIMCKSILEQFLLEAKLIGCRWGNAKVTEDIWQRMLATSSKQGSNLQFSMKQ